MFNCGDVIAINFCQIHLELAVREIEHYGYVTTTALAQILRATRQTQIRFNDGSSAKINFHEHFIVYQDPKGNILTTEFYDCNG
ncbi:hypothetical protein SGGMMB4_01776 [Sodalis glossinidius str. 'morsitans']|uniref:Uncharacterized protein n=1 Tax=Sodalis glossinidius (strain morsitans) TaxID=343509 RepID=A0A193QHF5_SODGM|nr:hypothetical protein SGGMMB4_01776 [Sodalis glossinidius str. 'morsitans']